MFIAYFLEGDRGCLGLYIQDSSHMYLIVIVQFMTLLLWFIIFISIVYLVMGEHDELDYIFGLDLFNLFHIIVIFMNKNYSLLLKRIQMGKSHKEST